MDRRERISHIAQDRDEELLLAHVADKLNAGQTRNVPVSTAFLTKRQQMLIAQLFPEAELCFFGGGENTERAVCVWLPDYLDQSWLFSEDGPVVCVRADYTAQTPLSHRDFLGALMGLGIRRETVGDIFTDTEHTDFLILREILPYVLQNLESAGRTRLRLRPLPLSELCVPPPKTKQIRDTVASPRLDAVVSGGFGISRAKAAELIGAGKAELNYALCQKPDRAVAEGDVISVRGLGKLRLSALGGVSRKGRLGIVIERYI